MTDVRKFPIMVDGGTKGPCPSAIPWEAIAPYEGMALENHQQSLKRLAERGGLGPVEAYFIMHGRTWKNVKVTDELEREACAFLCRVVRERDDLRVSHDHFKLALETILKCAQAKRSNFPKRMDEMTETEGKIALVCSEYAGDMSFIQDVAEDALDGKDWRKRVQVSDAKKENAE